MNARRRCLALLIAVLCVLGWAPSLEASTASAAQVSLSDGPGAHPGRVVDIEAGDPRGEHGNVADVPPRAEVPALESVAALAPHWRALVVGPRSSRVEPGQPRGPPSFVVS